MAADYTKFRHSRPFGEPGPSDLLESSLTEFLKHGFLCVGAFSSVNISQSGSNNNAHRLRPVLDPRQGSTTTSTRSWEGFRSDWVYESGIDFTRQPVQISGVFVNGGFQPATGVGAYQHKVDYPNGRVVFANAIPSSSVVTADYSYRHVRVASADAPWFRRIQTDTLPPLDEEFMTQGSGVYHVLAENRVQLPAVVVEVLPRAKFAPSELGTLARKQRQEVLFHLLTERPQERKQLFDVVSDQWNSTHYGIDKRRLISSGRQPLLPDGSLNPSGIPFSVAADPAQSGNVVWTKLLWQDVRPDGDFARSNFYYAALRASLEMDLPTG